MIIARTPEDFGPGPFTLSVDHDLAELGDDARIVVAFGDYDALFAVIGRARGAIHLGSYLTPFEFIHWRLDRGAGGWSLSTSDRAPIIALKRFYRLPAG